MYIFSAKVLCAEMHALGNTTLSNFFFSVANLKDYDKIKTGILEYQV